MTDEDFPRFPRMQFGLPRPETAKETQAQATLEGMRAAIERGSFDSSLIRQCLDTARIQGLNGEDTYTLLAYHALLAVEDFYRRCNEMISLSPITRVVRKDTLG
jgi:hypothetical protein